MKHGIIVEYKNIKLRPIIKDDLESLRNWRNDEEISKFLNPIGVISSEMQEAWFDKECRNNDSLTFAIEETEALNRIVGSVAIYDIKDNIAEIGKIVVGDKNAKGKKIGLNSMCAAMFIGFKRLGLDKLYLEVHENNIPALAIYTRLGFEEIGKHQFVSGGYEIEMRIERNRFFEMNNDLNEIKIL